MKSKILQYSITTGVCILLTFGLACLFGLFRPWQDVIKDMKWNIDSDLTKNLFVFTNAFFAVGVMTLCFGLLIVVINGGAFEMLIYGIRRFISLFQRDVNKIKFKTFYDYHVYHSNKPKSPFLYLVIVGAVFIGISMIFLSCYMSNYKGGNGDYMNSLINLL